MIEPDGLVRTDASDAGSVLASRVTSSTLRRYAVTGGPPLFTISLNKSWPSPSGGSVILLRRYHQNYYGRRDAAQTGFPCLP
jgi:hypothetical protein